MRFYTKNHAHYCGIDLHAKTMYLCIFDRDGQILLHKNMRSSPEAFLAAVDPFREDLVVAAECAGPEKVDAERYSEIWSQALQCPTACR